jgi:hypothetical protein
MYIIKRQLELKKKNKAKCESYSNINFETNLITLWLL